MQGPTFKDPTFSVAVQLRDEPEGVSGVVCEQVGMGGALVKLYGS